MLDRISRRPERLAIVVAGGAGFLGSHLSELLLRMGHDVICIDSFRTAPRANLAPMLDHPRFTLIEQDVCRPIDPGGRVDQIYNLACPASPPQYQADPVHTLMTNVLGTAGLLDLARRHGARFVQASTSEVYGDPEEHPQREEYRGSVNCIGPRACYDEGKRAAEALCFDHLRMGTDVRVARIFNTYGPRMGAGDGRIVSNFLSQALAGRPLTVYGTGRQTRSFCYVSDLVAGLFLLMALDEPPRAPVNLGNPDEHRVIDIARTILDMTGSASRIELEPLPEDDPRRRRPDISRARALLGWQPRVPLQEGLRLTAQWFAGLDEAVTAAAPSAAPVVAPPPASSKTDARAG